MVGDQEERPRVLGVPIGPGRGTELEREPQRVLGFPVDRFGPVDRDMLDALRHPVRALRRWRGRRAEGPYYRQD